MGESKFNIFYLSRYIQNIISTYTSNCLMRYFYIFPMCAKYLESCVYVLHTEQMSIQTGPISSTPWPSVAGGCDVAQPRFRVCGGVGISDK